MIKICPKHHLPYLEKCTGCWQDEEKELNKWKQDFDTRLEEAVLRKIKSIKIHETDEEFNIVANSWLKVFEDEYRMAKLANIKSKKPY